MGSLRRKSFGALAFHAAFEYEIGAVDDIEGFADVVVGDQDGKALCAQVLNDLLNVIDGDGIDAR